MKGYDCGHCHTIFNQKSARDTHQYGCIAESYGGSTPVKPLPPALSYREMVERESKKNAAYRKYAGRVDFSEPNGMRHIYIILKGR
jgi:uncharacterized protein VirK/YbjX